MQVFGNKSFMVTENSIKRYFLSSLTYWKIKTKDWQKGFKLNENQVFNKRHVLQSNFQHKKD